MDKSQIIWNRKSHTPVQKGDKLNVSNYWPISLLSSLSKILEKVVYRRTVYFLKTHSIFSNFQFGFREK